MAITALSLRIYRAPSPSGERVDGISITALAAGTLDPTDLVAQWRQSFPQQSVARFRH